MENKWIYLDDIKITDDLNAIHCDTRDFHCLLQSKKINLRDRRYPEITKVFYKENYHIKTSDIKTFLKNLETMSGGKGTWRLLSFDRSKIKEVSGWDYKYLRIYRIKNDSWVVCVRENEPILYQELNESTIDKEHLWKY